MNRKRSPWEAADDSWRSSCAEPLRGDITADVCIVGAGMAGLLCALELSERGRSVIVLERDRVAAGETSSTTAHLTALLDSRYWELTRMHGIDRAREAAASHLRAIAHLERVSNAVSNAYGIDCGFQRVSGFLCAGSEQQQHDLERELKAAIDAGLVCEMVRSAPLSVSDGPALHVPRQGEFEPLALLEGVVRTLQARGVRIYAPVTVREFDVTHATDQVGLRTSDDRSVRANYVVVATATPINDVTVMHTKQAAYRSYGICIAAPGLVPALAWDLEDPYHYVRTAIDAETRRPVLVIGGEDHRVGQDSEPEQHWQRLSEWASQRFPNYGPVLNHWSGQVFEPSDGLAFIGRNPGQERVLIVTGHSGNGMTYSAIAAELIADLVHGVKNQFEALYDPARKPKSISAIADYVRENLNTAEQYSDWLGPADAARIEDIQPGEGAVLRRGIKRVAVYVDPSGLPHEVSATCPHLGGVVAWNAAEKSWDCPCHGSRFDCYGKVIAGPASSDLEPVPREAREVERAS